MATAAPLVSVVTATYNRPGVLAFAIKSVIAQTLPEWEMIIVGDACTDDTEAVVASFGDKRVRFENLVVNFGEQSGPNNVGVGHARGRYIAYLNHDDLWFPDHLAHAVAALEIGGNDLVFAPGVAVRPADLGSLENDPWRLGWSGRARDDGFYDPVITIAPASTLVLSRDAAERIGPWRPAQECYAESSQDFLFRAWRQGLLMRRGPELSVLMFNSGERKGAYQKNTTHEQAFFWQRLNDEMVGLRQTLLALAPPPKKRRGFWRWSDVASKAVLRQMAVWGVSPREFRFRVERGMRRGDYIKALRRRRGLPNSPAAERPER